MFIKVVFVVAQDPGMEQLSDGSVNSDSMIRAWRVRAEDVNTRWIGQSARTGIAMSDGSIHYITTQFEDFDWTLGSVDVIADGVIPGQQPVAPEPAREPVAGNAAWGAIDELLAMNDNRLQQLAADMNALAQRRLEPARAPEPQAQPEDNNIAPPRRWNFANIRPGRMIELPVAEGALQGLHPDAQGVDNVPDF